MKTYVKMKFKELVNFKYLRENWREYFSDVYKGDERPDGYLEIVDLNDKEDLADDEVYAYTVQIVDNELRRTCNNIKISESTKREYQVPRKLSKLSIYLAISSLNGWQKIQTWLEGKTINGVNGWLAFQLAQEISEGHPLFATLSNEARELLGLSEEDFDALLEKCVLN